ncbi:MAG: fadK 2 [Ilumatobacteraceae bacterium]|nr:fadK 2 [Ilumatobacteraceae bacterium]
MMRSTEPTVWDLVVAASAEHPDRVVLADNHGRTLTTTGLRDAAERVAAGLKITADDVVSWQLPTVLEAAVLLVAVARVGARQNPIIPILREREVAHIVDTVHCTVFVTPRTWRGFDHVSLAEAVAGSLGSRIIVADLHGAVEPDEALRLPSGDPATLPPPPVDATGDRWLYFSSGTTAAPKGIRHTDASVIASSYGMTDQFGIDETDVYPIAWPITHIGGVTMLTAVLRNGGRLVLFDSFDPGTTGDRMAEVGPTLLGTGVPFFRAYLDAQRRHGAAPLYPALRAFLAGGAPTPPAIVRELVDVFGMRVVLTSWGLTEFPIATCAAPSDPSDTLETTAGRPARGVLVRVVDGELRLKGPQCFAGYIDAGLDADAFDEDGWFRTGDLGTIDADGYVTITGRLKDVIIRNGENVSALEVEDVLLGHPDIDDVAVIGLPDPRTGERVCAVVVTAGGRAVTVASIREHCLAMGLAVHKVPERVEHVEAVVRNQMGKIVKSDLREAIIGRVADGAQ